VELGVSNLNIVRAPAEVGRWDDLRIEPVARTTGGNSPAFEKYYDDAGGTSRGVYLYSFDDAVALSQKEIFFTMQMPHAWLLGSPIGMHVHWVGTTSVNPATPIWGLEYAWKSIGQTFTDTVIVYTTSGNIDGSGVVDTQVTAGKHYLSSFDPLVPGATADGLSSILLGRLFRFSGDASDTYTGTCGLAYIDAHYISDAMGSFSEFSKRT
jgi:hypothetical protein